MDRLPNKISSVLDLYDFKKNLKKYVYIFLENDITKNLCMHSEIFVFRPKTDKLSPIQYSKS